MLVWVAVLWRTGLSPVTRHSWCSGSGGPGPVGSMSCRNCSLSLDAAAPKRRHRFVDADLLLRIRDLADVGFLRRRCHLCNCADGVDDVDAAVDVDFDVDVDDDDRADDLVVDPCSVHVLADVHDSWHDDRDNPGGFGDAGPSCWPKTTRPRHHRFLRHQLCHRVLEIRVEIADSDTMEASLTFLHRRPCSQGRCQSSPLTMLLPTDLSGYYLLQSLPNVSDSYWMPNCLLVCFQFRQ